MSYLTVAGDANHLVSGQNRNWCKLINHAFLLISFQLTSYLHVF